MRSLLVIGGSGFFGKSILDAYQRGLLETWGISEVTILARNASKLTYSNPDLIDQSIKLINLDITIAEEIPYADYVIHAASSTDASRYLSHGLQERKNIQAATYNYCRLANNVHSKSKIIYISSGAVYGQQPSFSNALSEESISMSIDGLDITKRNYAAAKIDSEKAIQTLGNEGFNVSIARCFTFVGGYLPRNQHFAIGNFIDDGLNNRTIKVKATHPVYRSYMHADDLVRWLMTIVKNSSTECPIFNVGSDHAVSIGDLADKVANYFGVSVEMARFESNVIDRYVPSIEKAKVFLGLNVEISLEEAIAKSICAIKHR